MQFINESQLKIAEAYFLYLTVIENCPLRPKSLQEDYNRMHKRSWILRSFPREENNETERLKLKHLATITITSFVI